MGRSASISIAIDNAADPKEAIQKAKLDADYELFKDTLDGNPYAILVSQS